MAVVVKNPPANAEDIRDTGSIPGSGRSSELGNGNPLQFLPGKFHGQRSLADYSLRGFQELDMTENDLACIHRPVKFGKSISMIMLNQQLDGKDF